MSKTDITWVDFLIDGLIVFLLVYMPLAFGAVALQWRAPSFIAGVSLIALTAIRLLKRGKLKEENKSLIDSRNAKWPLMFMALFLLLIFIRLLPLIGNHPAPEKGWIALFTYMTAFSVFFSITTLVHSKARLKRIIYCIVAVGVFEAFYGLIEQISGHQHIFFYAKHAYNDVATGTFINRNHYAAYLVMSLSLCAGIFFYTWSRRLGHRNENRWKEGAASKLAILGFCLVLCLTAIWASASRAAPIMFIGALIFDRFTQRYSQKNKSPAKLLAAVAIIAILFSIWLGISPVNHRYAGLVGDIEAADGRPGVYATAWRMWLAAPTLGHGAGTFGDLFFKFRSSKLKVFYDHAHNDYLEILAEVGICGLAFFMIAVLSSVTASIWNRSKRKSRFSAAYAMAPMLGVLAFILHGLVDFNFQIPANLTTFFALLAITQVAALRRLKD